jgi:hypothetical protein
VDYFRVKNWDHYQHYRHRNPPWVKLYTCLLDDYEYTQMPVCTRLLVLEILMLAGKTGNKIPNNPEWLKTHLHLPEVDLDALFAFGLIESYSASELLAYSASTKERKIERKTEGAKALHPEAEKARARFLQGVPR